MENEGATQTVPSELPGQPGKPKLPEVNEADVLGRISNNPKVLMVGQPGRQAIMARFTLAVNRSFARSGGKPRVETAYVPVVAWHSLAKQCATAGKGSALRVTGRLKTWELEGRKFRWEIEADGVQILERRGVAPGLPSAQEELLPN